MGQPDYYAILGIDPKATPAEVARAYRTLMRSHHPDVEHAPEDRTELLRIMEAFAVLRDPVRRREYDSRRLGSRAQRQGGAEQPERDDAGTRESARRNPARGRNGRDIPVRHAPREQQRQGSTSIQITPVRWESGPWA
ncbi:J domain-containing protein [Pseudarthrobacter sp. J75]|uniref:J domain-containing protein n=1 Tax=unclassified Pseudarthrobacter TaxID=2647000 RepID=UPI002E819B0B|nr:MULTISPECIES: J domain-containing protein [unclassified Pseudarthrobacter]MEE2522318.1 J domain-containing protein [Pseudarthrobacter sp. J47]MEE2528036.1 J domain-containing protein [Pseudarthrobacter sp. J75]